MICGDLVDDSKKLKDFAQGPVSCMVVSIS